MKPEELQPPAIVKQAVSLKERASQYRAMTRRHKRVEKEQARQRGEALHAAKEQCIAERRDWYDWLMEAKDAPRTASDYIRVFLNWDKISSTSAETADMPLAEVLIWLAKQKGQDADSDAEDHGDQDPDSVSPPAPGGHVQAFCSRECRTGDGPKDCEECARKRAGLNGHASAAEETDESSEPDNEEQGEAPPAEDNNVPERLKEIFENVPLFYLAAAAVRKAVTKLQELEASKAYKKLATQENGNRKLYSTVFLTALQMIESMTPKEVCSECGGVYEPSLDADRCKKCGDKGFLTADEVE